MIALTTRLILDGSLPSQCHAPACSVGFGFHNECWHVTPFIFYWGSEGVAHAAELNTPQRILSFVPVKCKTLTNARAIK